MLNQLLQLLPNWLTQALTIVLVLGNVAGILLWILGGRFSRAMLTFLAITIGASVGLGLPSVVGWAIEPSCIAVCGAILLGTAAFLFHRTLIGIGLGAVAALWAVAAAWIRFGGPTQWHPGNLHWTGSMVTWLAKIWQSLPGELGLALPYACGAGLAGGVIIAVLWPRVGRCLLYSLIGATLILATGLPLAARLRPDWLSVAPASNQTQLVILFAFVTAGAALQWFLTRQPREPGPRRSALGVADPTRSSRKASQHLASPQRRATLTQYAPVVPAP